MKYLIYSLFFIPFLFSCQDDDQTGGSIIDPVVEDPVLFPLAVGNYWIYEIARVDNLGNEEFLSMNDTIEIIGDTIINNEQYYTWSDTNFGFNKQTTTVRDSAGFLINSKGIIILSTDVFDEVLHTSETGGIARFEYTMQSDVQNVTVPLGDFECLNYEGIVTHITDSDYVPRKLFNFYSDGVGLVASNTFFFNNIDFSFERRLVEFHLE